MSPRRMHLTFNLSYTHMNGRWRLPGAWGGVVHGSVQATSVI